MITGKFEYHAPESLPAAVGLLSDLGDDARVIAGGHSLIPMMKLRLATPEHLIDLRKITDLAYIRIEGETVRIGAMTTQYALIEDEALRTAAPIIAETSFRSPTRRFATKVRSAAMLPMATRAMITPR